MNPNNTTNSTISHTHLIYVLIPTALFITSYHDVLSWMYGRFISHDSYYSHGFIIPIVSTFLIWQKRGELKATKVALSWWGLILILVAALIHIAGTILYVFSLSGFSIFLFILGTSLFLFGKNVTRTMLFPLIFLIFMFPMPRAFIGVISFPMKMVVAKAGVWIVNNLGISTFREGFHITIPAGSLLVGDPCSGLRSLISFLALGSFLAYLTNTSKFRKLIIFILAAPVAILSNMLRVPTLILISHYWGLKAAAPDSFLHTASGFLVFLIGVVILFAVSRIMEWES